MSDNLREQLCQIEQSQGVCHMAELQSWPSQIPTRPSDRRRAADQRPKTSVFSALVGSTKRPPQVPKQENDSTSTSKGYASSKVAGVYQPNPPKTKAVANKRISPEKRGTDVCASSTGSPAVPNELDSILLDTAVDQLMAGKRLSFSNFDEENAAVPKVVPLGDADVSAGALHCAPRLPQQLADVRQQLRLLTANCDKLQQGLAMQQRADENRDAYEAVPLQTVESAHAAAMRQATRLLEAMGATEPTNMASTVYPSGLNAWGVTGPNLTALGR
eukprot:TRINITY_DN109862_c0_g1_i1.p1 TRINITY_DN109862_c0_g1~~TRINITY_DN109862_c0_g1_i1.p1  ORF type:complete len:274 (+),score=49.99 TRINITY_DN109862_c0_g1_i1:62-883(+)